MSSRGFRPSTRQRKFLPPRALLHSPSAPRIVLSSWPLSSASSARTRGGRVPVRAALVLSTGERFALTPPLRLRPRRCSRGCGKAVLRLALLASTSGGDFWLCANLRAASGRWRAAPSSAGWSERPHARCGTRSLPVLGAPHSLGSDVPGGLKRFTVPWGLARRHTRTSPCFSSMLPTLSTQLTDPCWPTLWSPCPRHQNALAAVAGY